MTSESTPNEDIKSAVPYVVGTSYRSCLQSAEDVDVYSLSIPDDSTGGYVTVAITGIGAGSDVTLKARTSADGGGAFLTSNGVSAGSSVYAFFAARTGAKFYLALAKHLEFTAPTAYTLTASYHQVPDAYEPNDLRSDAAVLERGVPAEAYFFAGREYSTEIPSADWLDWFQVQLQRGIATVRVLPNVSDIAARVVVYDPDGVQIASGVASADSGLDQQILTAGSYFIRVSPEIAPVTEGGTQTVPQYLRKPYTLTVTQ